MRYIVIIVVGILSFLHSCSPDGKSKYAELKKLAYETNKKCPIQLDSETRLDSVLLSPNGKLHFNQTIWLDTFTYDIRELKKSLSQMALDQVKASPDRKMYLDNSAVLEYNYFDTTGNKLFSFAITPDKYGDK
jgi:hypothetical protein